MSLRAVIAWPVAWSLFWVGDLVSKWGPYWAYNWLMLRSAWVQDWGGLDGPWGPPVA